MGADIIWAVVAVLALVGLGSLFHEEPTDRTEGLLDTPWAKSLPQAYVIYPPCEAYPHEHRSITMPIGNARDYAKIFGGKVVPV